MSVFIHLVPPKGDFIRFDDEEHYISKGIEWKLFTERTVKKELLYKSNQFQTTVTIVGYEEYGNGLNTIVVEFNNGDQTCIHPAYLKEMQSSNFSKEGTLLPVESTVEKRKISKPNANKAVEPSDKKKAEKMVLPEEKVHFTATVKEFTKKINHFTGEEDEVLLLDHVVIVGEEPIEIGVGWCGYSKTLKKAELAEGDRLAFDGKIVEKKFNKDIRYKINNPSKLKKVKE